MKKIQVILSKTEHEYDVYALLTSFFPGVEVLTKAEINEEAEGRFVIEETAENIIFTLNFEDYNCAKKIDLLDMKVEAEKKAFGRELYDFLESATGKSLPWGNLTGIRPTKLIRTMLEEEAKASKLDINAEEVKAKVRERVYKERRLKGNI